MSEGGFFAFVLFGIKMDLINSESDDDSIFITPVPDGNVENSRKRSRCAVPFWTLCM